MPHSENSITIDSGKILITESQKPMHITGNIYDLVAGAILAFCVGLIVSREVFFKTFKNVIHVDEVRGVKLQKLLFGNGNVYLKLKLRNKTREIFIDKHRAEKIKKELDTLR